MRSGHSAYWITGLLLFSNVYLHGQTTIQKPSSNFLPQGLELARMRNSKTGRTSSWDTTGANVDAWLISPGESRVLANIKGPGAITHIWMTQKRHYRECLLKITWDDAACPSVLVPLGDFFCLGNGIANSFQSMLFSASTRPYWAGHFDHGVALNCYVPMPFRKRAVVELVNESKEMHMQYFYIDYELFEEEPGRDVGYFHSEFHRANPFQSWAPELSYKEARPFQNKERVAWENNYVILETQGKGHYVGCNLSVSNFDGGWWGEGDDMIWVDGYKWPPDLHGTGSEDYLNQAWGMQRNAYLRNGSSIWEGDTSPRSRYTSIQTSPIGGYQTSYVFHIENPVRFQKEIRVTIEHGHGNHKMNEMSSVAYWYAEKPTKISEPPPVEKRMPVLRDNQGNWLHDKKNQCPSQPPKTTLEMKRLKNKAAEQPR